MAAAVYAADPAEAVHAIELDGLTALFHVPSGTTHIVAPPAPQILAALQSGAADAVEILERMAGRFDFDPAAAAEAVEARLAELEAAGLVRRA